MPETCYHPSLEGAQHGAKSLTQFLDYARASGTTGAQPSNFMLEKGKRFKSPEEIKEAFASRGLTLDGRALTDPLEVCLRAPLPLAGERALIREVYDVIQEAGDLTGVALGNFARQCAGSCSGTTPAPMAGGTAADAAAPETAGPATTPEGPSA